MTQKRVVGWDLALSPEPAWIPLGYHVTCVPDVEYPWPEADVRIIRREFDPGFTPVFRRIVYRTPNGSTRVFWHHGVARFGQRSQSDPRLVGCPMPSSGYGSHFRRPNIIERWFAPEIIPGSLRHRYKLPPASVAWGSWVMKWAKETYWDASAKEKQRYTEEKGREAVNRKARKAEEVQAAEIAKVEGPYQKQLVEAMTESDVKEWKALVSGEIRVDPETGQPMPDHTPFVHLQGAN